jgi:hypothetical protein
VYFRLFHSNICCGDKEKIDLRKSFRISHLVTLVLSLDGILDDHIQSHLTNGRDCQSIIFIDSMSFIRFSSSMFIKYESMFKGTRFDKKKSKRIAKLVILIL